MTNYNSAFYHFTFYIGISNDHSSLNTTIFFFIFRISFWVFNIFHGFSLECIVIIDEFSSPSNGQ